MSRRCGECTEQHKQMYGCKKDAPNPSSWFYLPDGMVVKRCPYAILQPVHYQIAQLESLLQSGILPDSGGWCDQSVGYTKAVLIASSTKGRLEEQKRKSNG